MRKTILFFLRNSTANHSHKFSCYGGWVHSAILWNDECLSANQGAITYVGNDDKAFMCSLDLTSELWEGPNICHCLDHWIKETALYTDFSFCRYKQPFYANKNTTDIHIVFHFCPCILHTEPFLKLTSSTTVSHSAHTAPKNRNQWSCFSVSSATTAVLLSDIRMWYSEHKLMKKNELVNKSETGEQVIFRLPELLHIYKTKWAGRFKSHHTAGMNPS